MLRNVFLKTLRDYRWSFMWWSVGIVLLVAFMVAFYPSVRAMEGLEELIEQYPEDLLALFGGSDLTNYATPAGYLNAEVFGIIMPILFIVFAIGQGSGAIAGEERARTMDMLLSLPVTRGRLVLEKLGSMVASVISLALIVWLTLITGKFVVDMDISVLRVAEMTVSLAMLGLTFGAVAFAVGCATGRRGLGTGVAAAAVGVAYVLNALSLIVDFMEPAKWLSPFYYYNGAVPLVNGLNLAHVTVLLTIILVCIAVAYFGFQRRDVRQ
jgi:ABC-2 type transport system permease protein